MICAAEVLFLASFVVFLHWFTKRTLAFGKSAGYVHPVIWTLAAGMITQFVAQAHLPEFIALAATINQIDSDVLHDARRQARIGVIHIMLVGFGKIKDDASYKYHENEGVIGWILLSLRLGLYGWFLWAVQSSAREGGFKIANFLRQFRIAGSLYFLAFPAGALELGRGLRLRTEEKPAACLLALVIVLVSLSDKVTQLFAQYLQHSVMTIGQMVMQTGFNLWLSSLFLTRGEYFKAQILQLAVLCSGSRTWCRGAVLEPAPVGVNMFAAMKTKSSTQHYWAT
ncbi:hypothetical protein AK812_SmicGene27417 [Symbiodinium microadriaticum]|uniref:GPR180/TMEM145 transmembrane domain-containing protein n=1 Tax=Symbiodinium microadriaticum TaxID=2951 RepID=A0A1Q9D6Y2_SYMMI|nr:hypothetical protein AK812_SmicGene27417 [Symbiodinium microadriaticum]